MRATDEADAQLAFLARKDVIHAVLTDDSDLIAQSCPRVLLKLDRFKVRCAIPSTSLVLRSFHCFLVVPPTQLEATLIERCKLQEIKIGRCLCVQLGITRSHEHGNQLTFVCACSMTAGDFSLNGFSDRMLLEM